uniref:PX domain-containing protein n=1 Tax=Mucochytrium quahogii TaxID=96639 RepID=A0A7S2SEQ7_9STRA|mmetsp:Transcript_19434/g.31980  ORF Transcript_19434/g.31980 Transcript_19434/m.31980 type:complete len:377 (-) Transcript_19434:166-1296(-)|eukprot:CAMPEP_0203758648 /NCGR_PEP_ID=MMETSP0098-20131031/11490_1 /ASSEMBLY_ACC=CAM_ASM_000208 /TAXON_ID=96639 /ORGANISM=" , Strain NY0313808BC1" /LENGTH=376 /DNA_ID=CAMNT_0050651189 /DNA_START=203 /DNA_END=1333 /DNA_ORIENTATION=-
MNFASAGVEEDGNSALVDAPKACGPSAVPGVGESSIIDFDEYDEQNESAQEVNLPRSTLTEVSDDVINTENGNIMLGKQEISLEDISTKIPASILKTFEPDSTTLTSVSGKSQDSPVLKALVSGLAQALSGDSVVTAPVLYKGFEWLGRIAVKPDSLRGNIVVKYRTYRIQAQILAGGHVLPWKIGRVWRYSELRKLLVDDFQAVVRDHGLEKYYERIIDTFPKKTWQTRNTDETAEFRGSAMEVYISAIIQITSGIIEEREFAKGSKRNRRKSHNVDSTASTTGSESASGAVRGTSLRSLGFHGLDERKNSIDEITSDGLGDVMDIIVTKLLNIDRDLRHDISQLSQDLGALIASAPTDHCHVTKEFKLRPQQNL